MDVRHTFAAAAAAMLLFTPIGASAQDIATGTWTGTISPPGGSPLEITYEVAATADGFSVLVNGPGEPLPGSDVVVGDDRLTFTFEPGTPVDCVLMLQDDGRYEGECVDAGGDPGVLVMIPPGDM